MQYQQTRQRFWLRHPWLAVSPFLGSLWLVTHADPASYPAIVGFSSATAYFALRRHRHACAITRSGLRARADIEHRLALMGDPRGTFGRFPPQRAGWFPDPARAGTPDIRYFDGVAWTGYTAAPSY